MVRGVMKWLVKVVGCGGLRVRVSRVRGGK